MKIKKENTLLESKLVEEDEVKQEIINPDAASEADIIKDIEKTEQNTGVEFDDKATSEEAKIANAYSNIVYNPYGTSNPGKVKRALQRSLEVALRQKRRGIHSDFPNILIYGQAGVGKSSVVVQFCEEHNIEYLEINVDKLSPEMISGIPYPTTDLDTGELIQGMVTNPMWNQLNKPCILFCDEVNRANERAADSLFALINNHVLPGAYKNKETKEIKSKKYFPNFLFTVSCINPPTAAFRRSVVPLDPAFVSRNSAIISQEADPNEWAKYFDDYSKKLNADEFIKPKKFAAKLDDLYQRILDDPKVPAEDKVVISGQNDLAQALVSNGLTFNTQDEVDEIYLLHKDQGITYNYLNPRSLSMFIRRSNGTKKDFLDVINNESGLREADKKKIKNCLATYTDKITVGNNLFGKAAPASQRTASSQTASIDALNTFLNGLA